MVRSRRGVDLSRPIGVKLRMVECIKKLTKKD